MGMAVASIVTAADIIRRPFNNNKTIATDLKGSADRIILLGRGIEPKCSHAVDTWQGILSDYPSLKDVRTVWVDGRNVEASATLAASGIPSGAFVRMHFILDLPRLPGGMMQGAEQPLRKEDLQIELQEASVEQKSGPLPEEEKADALVTALPVQEQAEKVNAGKSNAAPYCSGFQKFISSRKEAFIKLFPMVLVPVVIMLATLVLLFAVPKASFDGEKCIAPGTNFMMLETLVETCDCVQPELQDAYLNVSAINIQ